MLHHKTMVVDSVWSTIGTTNFDNRSFAYNEENNVCCHDRTLARSLEEVFEEDAASCDRVDPEAWRRRGIWQRAQEAVASLLEEQA
jgi:cardiolipin synthase